MRYEIQERINEIIENDSALTGIFRLRDTFPVMVQPPTVLTYPRQDSGYTKSGGNRFLTEVQFDCRVYLGEVGTRLQVINDVELLKFPDLFADAFLSRPQLQYNDTGLEGVVNALSFQIVSDLARPIEYPIGVQGAPRFWGFIARISVPYRQSIPLKVRGI